MFKKHLARRNLLRLRSSCIIIIIIIITCNKRKIEKERSNFLLLLLFTEFQPDSYDGVCIYIIFFRVRATITRSRGHIRLRVASRHLSVVPRPHSSRVMSRRLIRSIVAARAALTFE